MSVSRYLVDPKLVPLLDVMPTTVLTAESLPQVRATPYPLPPMPDATGTVAMETRTVQGPAGGPDISLVIYRPLGSSGVLPCIYHIHGGGYVSGSAAAGEPIHRPMSAELDCVIVSVDYRLAPETRFPGAIDDCYAGLSWLFADADELGVDPARIGVMGQSAGGGLAASLTLLTRDRGEHRLAFQHLIYPMLDDRTCTSSCPHPYVGEYIWTAQKNAFGWEALLGVPPGSEGVSPYAAAARADDLSGLPPAFIATGALDLFLEENLEYARRLTRHGVPVELHVYPGAYHGFDVFTRSRVALAARRDSRAALRRDLR